ncbi:MAG: tripartite tricarboxylate transporter TctB family protein [Rhodospirillales bacterium]|nr:tripartite tricarboxylate transporter TctB family protein [Rhodospirillales bacterium]
MQRLNRDAIIAIILLALCGVFFWASFDIRQPDYGVLMPSTWPRVIIGVLAFLSVLYLIQSLGAGAETLADGQSDAEDDRGPGFMGWVEHWKNPLWCFFLFFIYLLTLPVLGMLLGGIAFVFVLMGVLGGWDGKKPVVHAVYAVCSIGFMWGLFTFGLGVLLPTGMILEAF